MPIGQKGYDGYRAGIMSSSMTVADTALNEAYAQATMLLDDWNDPLIKALSEAQAVLRAARPLVTEVAEAAMCNYLDRR